MAFTEEELASREARLVEGLERRRAEAEALTAGASTPLDWLGVQRQAGSLLRQAGTNKGWGSRSAGAEAAFARYVAAVQTVEAEATAALAAADPDGVADAHGRLGLRVALIGKGGAGKTVISSTLARILARRGREVFAADLDTCPGLAFGLGLPVDDAGLPPEAVEEGPSGLYGFQLATGLSPDAAVERYAAVAPDGVRFLGLGKIGAVDKTLARRSVAAILQILLGFRAPDWDVIADLEAGPTTPFERYHAFSEDVVIVVGPAWRSAMTARRLLPMVEDRNLTVVSNRFRDEPDHPGLAARIRIPFDPELAEVERQGLAPLDACPESPAIAQISRLAALFVNQEVPV